MAEEKINIAQFDIDIQSLLSQTQEVKAEIDRLRKSQADLRKDGKTSSQQFIQQDAALKQLNAEYRSQVKVLGEVNAATGKTIPLQKQLDDALNQEAKTINQLRKQNADLRQIRNNVNLETAEGKKQLDLINAALNKNDKAIKENVSQQEQQRLNVGNYTESIKAAITELGIFGRYQKEATQILSAFTPVVKSLNLEYQQVFVSLTNVTAGTQGMNAAQKAAAITTNILTNALKLFRLALISTGIGAIVVALGALAAYFLSTQEGIDKVNRVLVPLKTVFETLLGVLQDLGRELSQVFTTEGITKLWNFLKGQFTTTLNAVGKIFQGIFTFDFDLVREGVTDIGNNIKAQTDAIGGYFDGVGDRIDEAWKRGKRIQELTEQIERAEIDLVVARAQGEKQLKEQEIIAKDTSLTMQERLAAVKEQDRIASEIIAAENEIIDLQIEQLKLKQQNNDTDRAGEKELQELIAQRIKNEERADDVKRRNLGVQNQLIKEQQALAQKAIDDEIKASNERLELFIAEQGFRAKSAEEELRLEQQIAERRKAILQQELDAKKISQTKYNAEILKLNNDLAKRQAEITVDNAKKELEEFTKGIQDRINSEAFLTEARAEEYRKGIEAIAEAERAYQQTRLDEGLITEEQFATEINNLRIEKDKELADLRKEREAARQEEIALQAETELEALEERGESIFEIESLQIEQQRERDLNAARQKYTDEAMLAQAILNINAQADRAQAQLSIEKDNAILKGRASLLGGIAKIIGEETALGKAAAIAQVGIKTYEAALNSYNALSGIPVVGPALGFAAATAATGFGIAQGAKIGGIDIGIPDTAMEGLGQIIQSAPLATIPLEVVPPFADGGKVNKGIPIHRSNGDNRLVTVKDGEVILNKWHQAMLGGDATFKAMGVPGFATSGVVGSQTATVQNIFRNTIDKQMADIIGDAVTEGARNGTYSGSQQGISDLSTERSIALDANF